VSDPLHSVAVSGLVTEAAGRVLLVNVVERDWELPGGRVEQGEDLLSALHREILEEAGCGVEIGAPVGLYTRLTPPHIFVHVFRCRHVAGEPHPRDEAIAEAAWFSPEDARRVVTRPAIAVRLEDGLDQRPGQVYRAYAGDPYAEVVAHRFA
jgi:8-oxo-dGTP diphosphatase